MVLCIPENDLANPQDVVRSTLVQSIAELVLQLSIVFRDFDFGTFHFFTDSFVDVFYLHLYISNIPRTRFVILRKYILSTKYVYSSYDIWLHKSLIMNTIFEIWQHLNGSIAIHFLGRYISHLREIYQLNRSSRFYGFQLYKYKQKYTI